MVSGPGRVLDRRATRLGVPRRRWPARAAGALSGLLLCAPPVGGARAAEPPQVIEELFAGEIAYPQERHELQSQVSLVRAADPRAVTWSAPVALEFGITDRFQLGIEVPFVGSRSGRGAVGGMGNIEIEALYNFVSDQERNLLLTAIVSGELPAPDRRTGEEGGAVEAIFAALKGFGPVHLNATLGGQLGVGGEGGEVEPGGHVGLAVLVPIGPVVPVLEAIARFEDGSPQALFAVGARWHPGLDFELGLGGWVRTDGAQSSFALVSECVWEVEFDGADDD